jgi:hypothetical protein
VISDTEVEIDLGASKVVALRYTIQTRMDTSAVTAVDAKKPAAKKAPVKKTPAKKPAVKKVDAPKKMGRPKGSKNKAK